MNNWKRINAHGHLLPEPHQIPNFMKSKKLFWIDENKEFMRQGDWKRPINLKGFFLNEKLEWMEQNRIDHEVVITLSQLYCNGEKVEDTKDVITFQNDYHAELQANYKDKFTCGFVVQPLYMDMALAEIERVVGLGLKVLCLPTHYLNKEGQWVSTGELEMEPIYELANHYGLAVEIHPYDGPKMIKLKDENWRFHLVWMCAQTADMGHMFSLNDFANKYPKARFCFAHGNQYTAMNLGRRKQGFYGRPDLFEGKVPPEKTFDPKNVFYDSIVHDVESFHLLLKRTGSSQIVLGLDNPYPLGEVQGVLDSYPGKILDEAMEQKYISQTECDDIWRQNTLNWLGK